MKKGFLYKCPNCQTTHKYTPRGRIKPQRMRTTCGTCRSRFDIDNLKAPITQMSSKTTPIQKRDNHQKQSQSIKPNRHSSTNLMGKDQSKNLMGDPPISILGTKNRSTSISHPLHPTPLWRSHCNRFRIDLLQEPKNFRYDKIQKRNGGWFAKLKYFGQWNLEVHSNCKNPNIIINITPDLWADHPQKSDIIAEEFALWCSSYLSKLGFQTGSRIERVQGNHDGLPNLPGMNVNDNWKIKEDDQGRMVIIDHSPDKTTGVKQTEFEVIDNHKATGIKLAYQIADAPKHIEQLKEIIAEQQKMITQLTNQISTLTQQLQKPIQTKEVVPDGIYN